MAIRPLEAMEALHRRLAAEMGLAALGAPSEGMAIGSDHRAQPGKPSR